MTLDEAQRIKNWRTRAARSVKRLDEHGRVIGYRNLSKTGQTLQPIPIRRRREDVLKDLPARMEKRFFVAMTRQQMACHEENRELVARLVQRWRKHGFLSESDQTKLQIFLQDMRMSCDSTYLLDRASDHGVKAGATRRPGATTAALPAPARNNKKSRGGWLRGAGGGNF